MTAARPLLLAALSVGLGCATVSVQTGDDAKTDFAKFKTYDFITAVPGQEQAPSVRNPVVREWINAAIQRELAGKGCSRAPTGVQPDFLVAYHAWGKTKVEVSQYGYGYYPGPYSYGYGMYPYGAAGGVVTDVAQAGAQVHRRELGPGLRRDDEHSVNRVRKRIRCPASSP